MTCSTVIVRLRYDGVDTVLSVRLHLQNMESYHQLAPLTEITQSSQTILLLSIKPFQHFGLVRYLTQLDDDLFLASQIKPELRIVKERGRMIATSSSSTSSSAPAGCYLELLPCFGEAEERSVDKVSQGDIRELKYKVFERHPATQYTY